MSSAACCEAPGVSGTADSTVRVAGGSEPLCAVKTAAPVPKGAIPACLDAVRATTAQAPVETGAVLVENLAGTGVALVATASVPSA